MVDLGGGGKGLDQFASLVPNTVVKTLATLRASGVDLTELARKAGIDIGAINRMLGASVTPSPSASPSPPAGGPEKSG